MFDEALEVVRDLALFSAASLGCAPSDVELERSCFAWALDPRAEAQNFGLPHRYYSYTESIGPGGSPTVVCAWTPLVDTSPENGCLYMVPRALDALWAQPGHPNHMRAAVRADGKELSGGTCHTMELNFNLAGAQPQILRAGDAVLWNGNTVHWGGACDPDCVEPRQSLGVTFRRRASPAATARARGGGHARLVRGWGNPLRGAPESEHRGTPASCFALHALVLAVVRPGRQSPGYLAARRVRGREVNDA